MEEQETTSALEQFRRQWQEEVKSRSRKGAAIPSSSRAVSSSSTPVVLKQERPVRKPPTRHPLADIRDDEEDDSAKEDSSLIQRIEGLAVRDADEDDFSAKRSVQEPKSALEHYEKAVEKESQGSLGDSLSHYRKAYRLDAKVDQSYKNKHFPAKSKPNNPNPSNAPVTIANTAHHSSKEPQLSLTTLELITNFEDLPIVGAKSMIEGDRPPPCPIKDLPYEVFFQLLQQIAVVDIACFARLSQVCKRLAYHVYHEQAIWKRVALGPEFGFASQLYNFTTDIHGKESINRTLEEEAQAELPVVDGRDFVKDEDWREVFHSYPRVRFSGVYISTVNYTRAGGASGLQVAWNNPIHIITYYRYLRFFRDGTVISLLTTNEPIDVVHHLTPGNLALVRTGDKRSHPLNFTSGAPALMTTGQDPPPTAQNLMKHALRGRWRLCHPSETDAVSGQNTPMNVASSAGDLIIETEGAGPRYMYTMHLSLKSGSNKRHAVKNNKLQWKGFWSYNHLTNDWAEFQLRNDRAFYFSRVKGYGLGY